MSEIRVAVAARDAARVMSASHALKGSVSVFGVERAVEAARILESMGRKEELAGVNEALYGLEREMALVLFALEEIATEGA
jgi:HPt (histidine-containing phosphotransfer) domain-containing protein